MMFRSGALVAAVVLALSSAACEDGDGGAQRDADTTTDPIADVANDRDAPTQDADVGTDEDAPRVTEQVLRVVGLEPITLDPVLAADVTSTHALWSLGSALLSFNADLEVEPGLAERWEISEDGMTVTFHLAEGIEYSNGDPIVAGDFVHTWRRLVDPREQSEMAYLMRDVEGALDVYFADPEVDDIDALFDDFGVEAPDDATVVVHLTKPAPYFVFISALWVSIPTKPSFTFDDPAAYVSSGPMVLTDWQHDERMVLEPNPQWFGREPTLDRIEMAFFDDVRDALPAYEAGDVDVCPISPLDVNDVRADEVLSEQLLEYDTLVLYYLGFDLTDENGIFARSAALRRAFSEAIDKEALLTDVFNDIGSTAWSLVPPGMPGHQDTEFLPYDTTQAQADFAAALTQLDMTADELDIELGYNTGHGDDEVMAYLQDQWNTVLGVELTPVGMEWEAYLERIHSGESFDIFRMGWVADHPHPANFLDDLIACDATANATGYCNEDVDDLLSQAALAPTLEQQIPLYNEAQEMVANDAPILPLWFGAKTVLVKPWVENLTTTASDGFAGDHFYSWVTIAPHD